jgi:hypothetical protein
MEQDLKLKGVGPATIRNYLLYPHHGSFARPPRDGRRCLVGLPEMSNAWQTQHGIYHSIKRIPTHLCESLGYY